MVRLTGIIITLLIFTILLPTVGHASDKGDVVINNLVDTIISEIESIRGLRFYSELGSELIDSDELRTYITSELTTQVPPEKERAIELVFGQLGLIPKGIDFLGTYESMYEEQAGGIYDWRENRMLIVSSNIPGVGDEGDVDGGMLALLGVSADVILRTVLAHELTHALEDQNFKFNEKFTEIQKLSSSDREFALQALVEGSATRLMMEHATGGVPLTPFQRSLNRILTNLVTDVSVKVPLYFKRTLTSPYTIGEAFVSNLMDNGRGWISVNAAYNDIPVSMEQVLHPDKYRGTKDQPSDVQLADFTGIIGEGSKELLQDTLGEMVIGILLDIQLKWDDFEEAPRGWDGDRLVGIEAPDGEVIIIWHSVWDSVEDANEFSNSLADFMAAKIPGNIASSVVDGRIVTITTYRTPDSKTYIIAVKGDEVIFVENTDADTAYELFTYADAKDVIVRK